MITIGDIENFNFANVPIDPFWNTGSSKELKMHRIHAYPAKFPAFITTKAFEYAQKQGLPVTSVADIFCGCGTTAFEARRNNIQFWGCDINPVATLIAKTKSRKYQKARLLSYLDAILFQFKKSLTIDAYEAANERLKYWYKPTQYNELAHLKEIILLMTPAGSDYQMFFLCAFSNILKPTSVWLTKSIKPQVDPEKIPAPVLQSFEQQCNFMITANDEVGELSDAQSEIVTSSVLSSEREMPTVDMIITSPPYVTSYEYADLHQLSSLWLDFAEDYRELREGSIGSLHHDYNFSRECKYLNSTGEKIVSQLMEQHKAKAKSVAKYFLDMQAVATRAYAMLEAQGIALFVIGNTEYKGVRIDNAKHLSQSLLEAGFNRLLATKRKISNKILTPYRDEFGKFSSDSSGRKIYSEEFLIVGLK